MYILWYIIVAISATIFGNETRKSGVHKSFDDKLKTEVISIPVQLIPKTSCVRDISHVTCIEIQ